MVNNLYSAMQQRVEACKCKTCRGLGTCDNAGPGDIMFDTWTCRTCDGSGINPSVVPSVVDDLLALGITTTSNAKEDLAFLFDFAGVDPKVGAEAILKWFQQLPERAT